MKKLLSAVFIVSLLSLTFAGCSPSVSDEFPKYESELQKVTQSDEYIFLSVKLLEIYNTYLEYEIWGTPEATDQLKENLDFLIDSTMTAYNQVNKLIIVSKNSEIQAHAIKHKELLLKYMEFNGAVADHILDGKPLPDLKAFVSTVEPGLRELNDELRELKFR